VAGAGRTDVVGSDTAVGGGTRAKCCVCARVWVSRGQGSAGVTAVGPKIFVVRH
jgi:hypothetical protein